MANHKRLVVVVIVIMVIILSSFLISGCGAQLAVSTPSPFISTLPTFTPTPKKEATPTETLSRPTPTPRRKATPTETFKDLLQWPQFPDWCVKGFAEIDGIFSDTEKFEDCLEDGTLSTREIFLKDPDTQLSFYKGSKSLSFLAYYYKHSAGLSIPISYVFDDLEFANIFCYEAFGQIAGGARTFGVGGTLLAEAQMLGVAKDGQKKGFEVEEFHYGKDGRLVFNCISLFDQNGFKIREREKEGRKEKDYYFIWPLGF